jgi:CheY-like chemotaxis protein
MSLAGNLADLSLGDILQILSLSQKSGELHLQWDDREIKLLFDDGKLLSVVPANPRQALQEFLSEKYGDKQPFEPIARVCEASENAGWGDFLRLYFQAEKIDQRALAEAYIQWLVNDVFDVSAGSFQFRLDDAESMIQLVQRTRWLPVMEPRLNPQMLAMEAARISDETQVDLDPEDSAVFSTASTRTFDLDTLQYIVVDDNAKILEPIVDELRARGRNVVAQFSSVVDVIKWLDGPGSTTNWSTTMFLVDLVMPKADRSGVLGGLDILEMLEEKCEAPLVVLMVDVESEQIEKRIQESVALGFVRKQSRRTFRDVPVRAAEELIESFDHALENLDHDVVVAQNAAPEEPEVPETQTQPEEEDTAFDDLLAGITETLEDTGIYAEVDPDEDEEERALTLMHRLLDELVDSDDLSEVVLLILRYASEIFDRAILLNVRGDTAEGLGQFGLDVRSADSIVRSLRIPLGPNSVFRSVREDRRNFVGVLEQQDIHQGFFAALGIQEPSECFVCPLITNKKVVGLFYGDNCYSKRTISGSKGMKLFLMQAGMALENAQLKQRVGARKS